jgi:hypothetical protein
MVRKVFAGFVAMLALASAPAFAQANGPSPGQMVEVDPIRCWWRTSTGAVRVGENFSIGLTCAVLEAEGVQVIPDQSQLNDSVIQLNPFEIVGGSHPADLRSGQRRFFQYEYVVRVLSPDVIGHDVPLPNLVVHYRVNSRLAGNAALQGRDLSYLLPPHTVRVLSIVPTDAADIRDTSGENFARIEALGVRAGTLNIAAITLVALGSLMAILALVSLLRGARTTVKATDKRLSEWALLGMASRELASVGRDTQRDGWNGTRAARALTALRIAAACAIGRKVSQRVVDAAPDAEGGDGRLIVRSPGLGGLLRSRLRGRQIALSSPVTAQEVARELERLPLTAPPARRELLESLAGAMAGFTVAQYGAAQSLDGPALDTALDVARAATSRLKTEQIWPRPHVRRWMTRTPEPEQQT